MKKNDQKEKLSPLALWLTIGLTVLLSVNLILLLVPVIEVYQPSYSKTVLGVTTYEGWYTDSASMAYFIMPIFLTGIPYICSLSSLKNRKRGNLFAAMFAGKAKKPVGFFWIGFGAVANLFALAQNYLELLSKVGKYAEYGAYCKITSWGKINIAFSIVLLVVSIVLSVMSKIIFTKKSKETPLEPVEEMQDSQKEDN